MSPSLTVNVVDGDCIWVSREDAIRGCRIAWGDMLAWPGPYDLLHSLQITLKSNFQSERHRQWMTVREGVCEIRWLATRVRNFIATERPIDRRLVLCYNRREFVERIQVSLVSLWVRCM